MFQGILKINFYKKKKDLSQLKNSWITKFNVGIKKELNCKKNKLI